MDIKLNYIEKGEECAPPLILLHGNGEAAKCFAAQLEHFSKSFHVIALDTRGHGKSPRGTAEFTIKQFACDLKDFMDDMGIDKADILGFSDGGNIALTFALRNPHRVSKLILNGANLSPDGVKRNVQRPIELGYKIASFFARFSRKAKANAEMLGLMVNEPDIPAESLKELKIPTLVIVGENDMIKESHSLTIARSIPGAVFRKIPGDHFIAYNNSAAFNVAVEGFLMSR